MKYLLTILLISFSAVDPMDIAKINALKEEAEKAYQTGNYEKSAEKYSYLLDTLNVEDEAATLNLANSYYKIKNNDAAISNYQKLQDAKDQSLKSLAYQQLGVISNDPKTLEKALSYFKQAIKSDPTNDDARYNYELLKKKLQNQNENQENNENGKDDKKQEPSDYAKKLKKQADKLVSRTEYASAHSLMQEGLKKDPTVGYYNEFINRLSEVSEIDN